MRAHSAITSRSWPRGMGTGAWCVAGGCSAACESTACVEAELKRQANAAVVSLDEGQAAYQDHRLTSSPFRAASRHVAPPSPGPSLPPAGCTHSVSPATHACPRARPCCCLLLPHALPLVLLAAPERATMRCMSASSSENLHAHSMGPADGEGSSSTAVAGASITPRTHTRRCAHGTSYHIISLMCVRSLCAAS